MIFSQSIRIGSYTTRDCRNTREKLSRTWLQCMTLSGLVKRNARGQFFPRISVIIHILFTKYGRQLNRRKKNRKNIYTLVPFDLERPILARWYMWWVTHFIRGQPRPHPKVAEPQYSENFWDRFPYKGSGTPASRRFLGPSTCDHAAWETATKFCMLIKQYMIKCSQGWAPPVLAEIFGDTNTDLSVRKWFYQLLVRGE